MYTSEIIQKVWEKGIIEEGYSAELIRKDACGAWIVRSQYGNLNSPFGWEIDHIYPRSKLEKLGVSEELIDSMVNLRPMQHDNNLSKSDSYPSYLISKTAKGEVNVDADEVYTVNEKIQQQIKKAYDDFQL